MSQLDFEVPWDQQPQEPWSLSDWARDSGFAWVDGPRSLSGVPRIEGAGVGEGVGPHGRAVAITAAVGAYEHVDAPGVLDWSSDGTLVVIYERLGTADGYPTVFRATQYAGVLSAGRAGLIHAPGAGTLYVTQRLAGDNGNVETPALACPQNETHVWVARRSGGTLQLRRSGGLTASTTGGPGPTVRPAGLRVGYGHYTYAGTPAPGRVYLVAWAPRAVDDDVIDELLAGPAACWRLLSDQSIPIPVIEGGDAGSTSVASDLAATYSVRGSVNADHAAAYAVRGAVSADKSAAYAIRGEVAADRAATYAVRGSVSADHAAAYVLRGAVGSDVVASYAILGAGPQPVWSDITASYVVRGHVKADQVASYSIRGLVQSDLAGAYAIRGGVFRDLAGAYTVRGSVARDQVASFVVRGEVAADLPAAYVVRGAVGADLKAIYSVLSEVALTPVWSDLTATWAIRGAVAADLAGAFGVRGAACADLVTVYYVHAEEAPVLMTYATQSDMVVRFGEAEMIQLTDRSPAATAIDAIVLQRALIDASAEIDAHLMARYRLPLASLPRLLVNAACDIARYRLYDDRCPEHVQKRYDNAMKLLQQISAGKLQLGVDDDQQQATPTGGLAKVVSGGARAFSRGLLDDYSRGGK